MTQATRLEITVFAVLAYALICLGAALDARAHGDAQWIADDPKTAYCCGVEDCHRDDAGRFVPQADGSWRDSITGKTYRHGQPDVHPSRDGAVWWCQPKWMTEPKCVFLPAGRLS